MKECKSQAILKEVWDQFYSFELEYITFRNRVGIQAHIRLILSVLTSLVFIFTSQMPRSGFMTWGVRRPEWMNCLFVFIWYQTSMNSCPVKPWMQPVSVATNTWWRTVVKILFICVWGCIRSMLSGSTKCCHVLELIGKFDCTKPCLHLALNSIKDEQA